MHPLADHQGALVDEEPRTVVRGGGGGILVRGGDAEENEQSSAKRPENCDQARISAQTGPLSRQEEERTQ